MVTFEALCPADTFPCGDGNLHNASIGAVGESNTPLLRGELLFLAAPIYTIVGFVFLVAIAPSSNDVPHLSAFILMGYGWVAAKLCWYWQARVQEKAWAARRAEQQKREETMQREEEFRRRLREEERENLQKKAREKLDKHREKEQRREIREPHQRDKASTAASSGRPHSTTKRDDDSLAKHRVTLGVGDDATDEEIKQAYRDLAKVWHPDRFSESDERLRRKAEEQFKVIQNAYEQLQRVGRS